MTCTVLVASPTHIHSVGVIVKFILRKIANFTIYAWVHRRCYFQELSALIHLTISTFKNCKPANLASLPNVPSRSSTVHERQWHFHSGQMSLDLILDLIFFLKGAISASIMTFTHQELPLIMSFCTTHPFLYGNKSVCLCRSCSTKVCCSSLQITSGAYSQNSKRWKFIKSQ